MKICGFSRVFERFCEINASTEGFVHDIGKVRDKYTEILEAVGITVSLLRAAEKTVSFDGETIKGGTYIFPIDSVEFCAEAINRYTSRDFKKLRSANFREMSLGETQFLVDGFTRMVRNLGYSHEVILQQYRIMERRLHYKLRLSEKALEDQLQYVRDQATEYQNSYINMNYDDKVYFIRYMASKVQAVSDYIGRVHMDYCDGRSDELYEQAEQEAAKDSSEESLQKINKELVYADALEHDSEYQDLQKQLMELLAEDTFVKLKKARFNKIQGRLEEIRKDHQIRLFGELLPEDEDTTITVEHPLVALQKAVEYADGVYSDWAEREEKEASKTPEDIERERLLDDEIRKFLVSKGMNFELPNTDIEEEELFMESGNLAYKLKGMISFPCCKKEKIMVYEGSSGRCSIKCPRCSRYAIFDYDKMEAEQGETLRGASHRLREK